MDIQDNKENPVIVRHHKSGVWIGYLLGDSPGVLSGKAIRLEGRRIWSWSGGRLGCGDLARLGCQADDRLDGWVIVDLPVQDLVEICKTTIELVENARVQ